MNEGRVRGTGELGGVGRSLELSDWEGQFEIGRFAFRIRENIGYDTF